MQIAENMLESALDVVEDSCPLEGSIGEIVSPILDFHALSLVDVSQFRQRRRHQIRIILYKKGGVSVSDLAYMHAILYPRLTTLLNDRDLVLELSSPGIDYVFKHDRDYTIFCGNSIKLLSRHDQLWHTGTLIGRDEKDILIENEMGMTERYTEKDIIKASLNNKITERNELK